MRRLRLITERTSRIRGSAERGATATIVAVLLGGGVLLGATALSVDVGSLMWERRQLQNSADAASMAMAQLCAKDPGVCVPGTLASLAGLSGANAADNASAFGTSEYEFGVCGRGVPGLPECDAPTSAIVDCPALPPGLPSSAPYVEVYTSTLTGSGGTVLPPIVAQSMGFSGSNVKACARAAWGAPGTYAATVPVTFSYCEWLYAMNDDPATVDVIETVYAAGPKGASPGYGTPPDQTAWPDPSLENVMYLQDHGDAEDCGFHNSHDVPGGFGYLSEDDNCLALVATGGWARVETGASPPKDCNLASLRGTVVDIPIFDCTYKSTSGPPTLTPAQIIAAGGTCKTGTGSTTYYHIKGWAKLYISGYRLSGGVQEKSLLTGDYPCTGGDRCLSGWFVEGVLRDASSISGGPGTGYGTYVVLPAG